VLPPFFVVACGCEIDRRDQVFLIDEGTDGGLPLGTDAATAGMSLDCSSTVAPCVENGVCRPACTCVLQRVGYLDPSGLIDSCALEPNAAAPSVRVKYRERATCPPY
jgi:hypothetical protein